MKSSWQAVISDRSDLYRRRFLGASFLLGLLLPATIAVISWESGESWNFLPLLAVEVVLIAGFAASKLLPQKGIEILITILLAAYPLAYSWGTFSPGNHQTYIVVLLCMPPIFDSLSHPRWYWLWCAYAVSIVAVTALSFLIGFMALLQPSGLSGM
jgi:hypothetical protein